jgi:hypothetical protein
MVALREEVTRQVARSERSEPQFGAGQLRAGSVLKGGINR